MPETHTNKTMAAVNPYEPPQHAGSTLSGAPQALDWFAMVGWPVVFGLNLVVPLLLSLEPTRDHGQAGMVVAAVGLLLCGWLLCYVRPGWARRLIFGSVCLALTQLFPILQVLAGLGALGLAQQLGFLADPFDPASNQSFVPSISSELGGFVVTLLVGGLLLACASAMGLAVSLLVPKSWLDAPP